MKRLETTAVVNWLCINETELNWFGSAGLHILCKSFIPIYDLYVMHKSQFSQQECYNSAKIYFFADHNVLKDFHAKVTLGGF